MERIHDLELEPLASAAFAPFGTILGEDNADVAVLSVPGMNSWEIPFESDAPCQVMFNRFYYRPLAFRRMERHFHVTQVFFPIGRVPFAMVVAPVTSDSRADLPNPEDVRAFYADGRAGVLLWIGVWHAVGRFPISTSHIDFGFVTDVVTEREIEEAVKGGPKPRRTQVADYAAERNVSFSIRDPAGLIGAP